MTQREQSVHHHLPEGWNQVKNLPAMWETRVQSLDPEDPLEKEMATHSSSPLENPRDGGAWWAAIYGVAQSRTRLKRLGSSSSSNVRFRATT